MRPSNNTSNNKSGFTLIELLVAIAVVAILTAVAVPNFSNFIANARARADIQQLVKSLIAARSEAVTRSVVVNVTANAGGWSNGWQSWLDLDTDGSVDDGETLNRYTALESAAQLNAEQAGSAATAIAFDGDGFLQAISPVAFAYRTDPEYCARDRDIRVSPSGQVSVRERSCP